MNIFITNSNSGKAARDLDDKRLKHMPKESIEMLAAYIHSILDKWVILFPMWENFDGTRKLNAFYLYHNPCSTWVRKDKANMSWLLNYTAAMLLEQVDRGLPFDMEMHKAFNVVNLILSPYKVERDPKFFRNSSLYKQEKDPIEAYRLTMMTKWLMTDKVPPVWSKNTIPLWYNEYKNKLNLKLINNEQEAIL